jgi:hypothetical protein
MIETMTKQELNTIDVYSLLRNYSGTNQFMLSLKMSLIKWGKLTQKQLPYAIKFFQEQQQSADNTAVNSTSVQKTFPSYKLKNSVLITLRGQFFVKDLCENKLMLGDVISYAWVVSEVTGITEKAIRVKAKIADSKHNLNFCRACCRSLTDKFSIATGMGKICSEKYGVPYIKDMSQVGEYKLALDNKIASIGEKEFWLPKSKVNELSDLLNELENSKIVKAHNKEIDKVSMVSYICDKLMQMNISMTAISSDVKWSVIEKGNGLTNGMFADCSKYFIDRFNQGNDCELVYDNGVLVYNLSNIK